jgi:Family of unknown function (DUF5996)
VKTPHAANRVARTVVTQEGRSAASLWWPELTLSAWPDTMESLHLWFQIVGKVRLALEPMVNHWWQVPLYVSARGLTTSVMPVDDRGVEIEFDFLEHVLDLRSSDGRRRQVRLQSGSVASFYARTTDALQDLDIAVSLFGQPVEMEPAVPFVDDTRHRRYDPDAAARFWRALIQAHRVMTRFRAGFLGKASPVHFFWGAADLAVTRFSGRTAPMHPGGVPNCPDWVQQMAYSHELHSCGFWPGGSEEGSFYAYAYPEPKGFSEAPVRPGAAYYDQTFQEFLLPYSAVRQARDPDAFLLQFFQSTYEAAADLAAWDRPALEVR